MRQQNYWQGEDNMDDRRLNHYIYGWLEKTQENIEEFKRRTDVTDEERAEFITFQYHLVMIINRALSGKVLFTGAQPVKNIEQTGEIING